jgi:drug/metabolite transporter (DMT)-like permease
MAAYLYGTGIPLSKQLLSSLSPILTASLLYLGAGIGMLIIGLMHKDGQKAPPLGRGDYPYIIAMVVLDIAAPVMLMYALSISSAAVTSLISNFEVAATAIVALVFFREPISKRLWLAIILISTACLCLTLSTNETLAFSVGSIFALGACLCWGFENNCTKAISSKDPRQIVAIKGLSSGLATLLIATATNALSANGFAIASTLLLGFLSYGLSIYLYIRAQRDLGAARTSALYASAPFVGVLLSVILYGEEQGFLFAIALTLMIAGVWLAAVNTAKETGHA